MTPPRDERSLFSVLRHKSFAFFWSANLISGVGVWMQSLAQYWLILKISNSELFLGLCGFATLVPTLLLSLVGGTLADRMNRRTLLIITQTSLMLIALALALLTAKGLVSAWLIVALAFLSGIAVALNSPAYQAVIPDLVPPEDLTRAIALNSIQFNVARIGGHAVAGLVVATNGEAGCFLLNGLSYFGMIAVLCFVVIPSRHVKRDTMPFRTRLVEGVSYVRREPMLRGLILIVGAISLLGLPYFSLLAVFARDVLKTDARGLGWLTASVSVGALAAGLLMTRLTARFGKKRVVLVAAPLFWISLIAFSCSESYWLSCGLLVALGLTLVLTLAPSNNILQEKTPPEQRGRTMSVYSMAANGLAPLGTLLVGILANRITAPTSILAFSVAGLLLTAILLSKLIPLRLNHKH